MYVGLLKTELLLVAVLLIFFFDAMFTPEDGLQKNE